jgi:hexosaminidase
LKKSAVLFATIGTPVVLLGALAAIVALTAQVPTRSTVAMLATPTTVNATPVVIPSLRDWHGGYGFFRLGDSARIVVNQADAAPLAGAARAFHDDLRAVTGRDLPVATATAPRAGDFYLTLGSGDAGLGAEGYRLLVGDSVNILANASNGAFYGTRTVLQILADDPSHTTLPRGTARDYPAYAVRGFMLDVGRKFFPLAFLEDYVRFMAWYKMNDFQLHLNDNAVDAGTKADWMHEYAAFRLNSPRFPGLAAHDGAYTEADMRALQDLAREYAVTITPEIDAPAHDLAFTQYDPALALPGTAGTGPTDVNKESLDLNNPASFTFLNAIWDTFLPWFDATQMHIGADEYFTHSTTGPDPRDATVYRRFVNRYIGYLAAHGKGVRMWASLDEMASTVPVDHRAVMVDWDTKWANPVTTARAGYDIINASGHLLYIVPHYPPSQRFYPDALDAQYLYAHWEPTIFDATNAGYNLALGDPHLLGGMFAEWNDMNDVPGGTISDADVHARVKPAMSVIGQKLWDGAPSGQTYAAFMTLAARLGDGPGTHLPAVAPLTS